MPDSPGTAYFAGAPRRRPIAASTHLVSVQNRPLPDASSYEPVGLTAHIQYGAGSTDAQRLMGPPPNTDTKLKAPPRSSLPDGAFPASPFSWLYVFQPVGTSPRSGGALFMPLGLPHAAKSSCVNDLLGNRG